MDNNEKSPLLFIPVLREAHGYYLALLKAIGFRLFIMVVLLCLAPACLQVLAMFAYNVTPLMMVGMVAYPFFGSVIAFSVIAVVLAPAMVSSICLVTQKEYDRNQVKLLCMKSFGEVFKLSIWYALILTIVIYPIYYILIPISVFSPLLHVFLICLLGMLIILIGVAFAGYAVPIVLLEGHKYMYATNESFACMWKNLVNILYVTLFFIAMIFGIYWLLTIIFSTANEVMGDSQVFQYIYLATSLIIMLALFMYMLSISLLMLAIMYKRTRGSQLRSILPQISEAGRAAILESAGNKLEPQRIGTPFGRVIIIIINVLMAILAVVSLPTMMMSAMAFGSGQSALAWVIFYCFVSFPVFCVLSIILSNAVYSSAYSRRQIQLAFVFALLPVLNPAFYFNARLLFLIISGS